MTKPRIGMAITMARRSFDMPEEIRSAVEEGSNVSAKILSGVMGNSTSVGVWK